MDEEQVIPAESVEEVAAPEAEASVEVAPVEEASSEEVVA